MGKITSLLDLNSYFKSYETMKIVSRIYYVRFFLGHGVDTFTLNLIKLIFRFSLRYKRLSLCTASAQPP